MKSIKEKSEEYIAGFHPSIQRMCSESYIDGANYVLDEIGRIVTSAINNKSKSIPTWRLNYIIKQLKK